MKNKLVLFFLLLSILVTGCKTQYIPLIKTEYKNSIDSIIMMDSIYINQYIKGDTIYLDREIIKWRKEFKKDTLVIKDTIPKIVEVEKVIYKTNYMEFIFYGLLSVLVSFILVNRFLK